jgi:hypothetical protein
MSMKVVFLKEHNDHINSEYYKPLDETFISRTLGRRLCQQEIAIPASIKKDHVGYNALLKKIKRKNRPVKKTAPRKAVSRVAKKRTKAVKS